ncbi:hypothetical protein ZHAS_00003569 [Anopheles sinensis]|uniref:Uncharacterized protein n=1 Tax=Anopheles sinensis TaxID=74873 RepID=A0A084VEK9_ANOSI|nr:hypothetical protein ZHAS_00003569 [Anopheles sinensis]
MTLDCPSVRPNPGADNLNNWLFIIALGTHGEGDFDAPEDSASNTNRPGGSREGPPGANARWHEVRTRAPDPGRPLFIARDARLSPAHGFFFNDTKRRQRVASARPSGGAI